jgi:nicotinamidase-related amidase
MNTVLLLIDLQEGLDEWDYYGGERNNHKAESNASRLLSYFRAQRRPIIHVKHNSINQASPLHPSKTGNAIKPEVYPLTHEIVLQKHKNSAFIDTDLDKKLKELRVKRVIIAGLTIEHCISSTVRMSANMGYETILIGEATAAFAKRDSKGKLINAQTVFEVSLANLKDEFAKVLSIDELIIQLGFETKKIP